MTIRTILVPVRGDGKGEGVLDHALALGRRFHAHLDVVHCRPQPEDMLPFGVSVPAILKKDILASASSLADEEERKVKDLFEDYCRRNDLTLVAERPWPDDRISVSWREKTGKQAAVVGLYGRLVDLVAVAQLAGRWHFGLTQIAVDFRLAWAACLERATCRRIHGRRNIAFQNDVLFLHACVGNRDR